MKSSWKELASVYIGTVIGAGFASGQEIIQFFGEFGYMGIFGVILASILFSIVGSIVLLQVYRNKIKDYNEFITPLFGPKISKVIEIIMISFLFIGFCVMLAGSGAIFKEQFNMPSNIGIYIMALFCFFTLIFSVKGISFVNNLVVPFLIVGIVLVGTSVVVKDGFTFSNFYGATITKTGNWLTSAILYVSYNSISAIVIMTSLLPIITSERQAIKAGIFGGLGLGVMAIFILISTLILYNDIYSIEIPMLKAAQLLGYWGAVMYSVILWLAMFTTAIASGFGCINRLSSLTKEKHVFVSAVFCVIAIPFAKIGFSSLVVTLYPVFGYLGLYMLIYIIANQIFNFNRRKSY